MSNQPTASAGSRAVTAIAAGLALGVLAAIIHALIEPFGHYRPAIPYMGTPGVKVLALYLAFGCGIGLLSGIFGALFSASRARPVLVTIATIGFTYTAVFLMRNAVRANLSNHLLSVLFAVGLWSSLAFLLHRWISGGFPQKWIRTLGVVALLVTLVVAGWSSRHSSLPARDGAADAPNILIVLVDALRSDHLGAYGYRRPTSPVFDRLAAEGTLFENAYAHGNRTILSTPALFTSLYKSYHGAVGFKDQVAPLPDDRITITELARDAGYTTLGMMSNIYLKSPFNLTQGFDRLEEFNTLRFRLTVYRALVLLGFMPKPQYVQTTSPTATEVTDAAITWLDRARGKQPVFLYAHYMDVHHEYTPPQQYAQMFESGNPEVDNIDAQMLFLKSTVLVKQKPPIDLSANETQRLRNLYDACIRYTDEEIGRLIDHMESLDPNRELIVVFTSDHGDEFMEHGSLYHTNLLHEELIRVPLLVWRSQDKTERRVSQLARHVDVLPTMAEWLNQPTPPVAMGQSLNPAINGTGALAPVSTIAEGDYNTALVADGWKIVVVESTQVHSERYLLYNLAADPKGLVNVAGEYPDRLQSMSEAIDNYFRKIAEIEVSTEQEQDAEVLRQLRDLGYLN